MALSNKLFTVKFMQSRVETSKQSALKASQAQLAIRANRPKSIVKSVKRTSSEDAVAPKSNSKPTAQAFDFVGIAG